MPDTLRASTYLDKGGTGKTTSTAHLGAALHELGHRVLLIDLAGKQGDLADALGAYEDVQEDIENEDDFPNIATTMGNRWQDVAGVLDEGEAIDRLVYETSEGFDLIPAHPDLDGLDADLGNVDDTSERYGRLRRFLDDHVDPLDRWDVVLLDLPGAANNITYNGLWATHDVLAPVAMGSFELKQARALENDLAYIRDPDNYGVDVRLTMLIPNLYDRRTNLDEEILEEFEDEFGDTLAPEIVVDSQQVKNVTDAGHSLFALEDDELSNTGRDARDAFLANARELHERLQTTTVTQTND